MAHNYVVVLALVSCLMFTFGNLKAQASDPELTTDFFVDPSINVSLINSSYFTFTGFRDAPPPAQGSLLAISPVFTEQLPSLTGLGVSFAFFDFLPGGMTPPHIHPRGSELFCLLEGNLTVGLIDSSNKFYSQSLQPGDVFVFPKGLVHFEINNSPANMGAKALAAFSSSNPGTVLIPENIFGSNPTIDPEILGKAFSVGIDTIAKLEAPFLSRTGPPK